MLSYLLYTIKAVLLASVIGGTVTGYERIEPDRRNERIMSAGALAGLLISIVIAYLRNNTNKVSTATINTVIYTSSLCAFVLLIILCIAAFIKKGNKLIDILIFSALAVFIASLTVYSLPEVLMYPHQVMNTEKSMVSTDLLLKMTGVLFGLVISFIAFMAALKCTSRISKSAAGVSVFLQMLFLELIMLSGILSVNLQNGNIKSNHAVFSYVVFVKNHRNYFIYISFILLFAEAVYLLIKSLHVNEAYRNPAEHRKIRAKWRNIRRWAVTALCSFALTIINLTVVEAYNSKDVTLSPVEDTEYDDENMYVTFEQVSDGHLHRFAYESADGVSIRFIVIKKTGSSTYGIGLDACDICGETGYYEKDGQVVCKLCDVVMNVNTIGFKGGCNPIVIPYEIKNGRIIVPISGLLEYEKEFR